MRGLLIIPAGDLLVRDRQTFEFPVDYFLELSFSAGAGAGDEEQNQTVPRFAQFGLCFILHGEDKITGAIGPNRLLWDRVGWVELGEPL
jgi:hypothetical protein